MSSESFGQKLKNYIKNLFNFSKYDLKTKILMILFIGIVLLSIVILYYNYFRDPSFLSNIIIKDVVIPIRGLGWIGVIIMLGFMILQAFIVPIPSELVLLSIGIIFGFWGGTVVGLTGSMIAAAICFNFARRGGRPVVEKVIGEKNLGTIEKWLTNYGFITVLIGRTIPFMSFDIFSYGAGFVKTIKWRSYIIATLIGGTFRAFFYAYIGNSLIPLEKGMLDTFATWPFIGPFVIDWIVGGVEGPFNFILLLILIGLGSAFLVYQFILMPILRKRSEKAK